MRMVKKTIDIDFDKYDIPTSYAKIHIYLSNNNRYSKLESANFSDIDLDEMAAFLISKMEILKKLSLRNNPNINFKSEEFKNLCKQLVELDVSSCDIDEETFSIICNNCSKLEVLKISNSPRINICHQQQIKFKNTLKELKIDRCDLSLDSLLEITAFESLQVLDVSENYLPEFFGSNYSLNNTSKEFYPSKVGMK